MAAAGTLLGAVAGHAVNPVPKEGSADTRDQLPQTQRIAGYDPSMYGTYEYVDAPPQDVTLSAYRPNYDYEAIATQQVAIAMTEPLHAREYRSEADNKPSVVSRSSAELAANRAVEVVELADQATAAPEPIPTRVDVVRVTQDRGSTVS